MIILGAHSYEESDLNGLGVDGISVEAKGEGRAPLSYYNLKYIAKELNYQKELLFY